MRKLIALAALALATAGAVEALASQRGVGYSPPAFAISQFLRSDGKEIRRVRWPMDLSAEPWAPGAPPGTPPVDYNAYYRRYGIAGTPAVAALHGVVQGKWDWAVAASPHHGNYDTALEWACRERPGLLGRASTGPWDCRVTARELEDATATGDVARIYQTWRIATGPPPPVPDPPPPVPPPVPPPTPPPATSCPEACPSKQWGWPQCQPCPCPEGVEPGPRSWGQVHCTPAEAEEPEPPAPPVRTCVEYAGRVWVPVVPSTGALVVELAPVGEGPCPEEVSP